jgi:GGDEF domain-containing protein
MVLGYPSTALDKMADQFGLPVDQWLPPDIENEEFVSRTLCLLNRTRYLLELSADTGLPGKTWMFGQLQSRIDANRDFALALFDIDRFKSVVDAYGFARAGDFLQAMAEALRRAVARTGSPRVDLGHIGGDDFLAICDPDQVLAFTKLTVTAFEQAADVLYEPIDYRRGYIEIPNRWGTGQPQRAALVTLSIGVAESTEMGRRLRSPHEVATVASEMKKVAKSQRGSYVAIDRRRSTGEAA